MGCSAAQLLHRRSLRHVSLWNLVLCLAGLKLAQLAVTRAGLPGIHADGFVMREHQVIDNLDVYYVVESIFTGLRQVASFSTCWQDGDFEEEACAWIC